MTKLYDDAAWKAVAAERDRLRAALEKAAPFLRRISEHLEASDMPGQAGNCTIHAKALEEALANTSPAPVTCPECGCSLAMDEIGELHCPQCGLGWGESATSPAPTESVNKELLDALRIAVRALEDNDIDESMSGEFELLTEAIAKAEKAGG